MRNRFLVCYDVSDPKRLARTYKKMNGFGEPAQYSVFICDLSPKERVLLEEALTEILNLKEDRALIVDMGPSERRGSESYAILGNARELPRRDGRDSVRLKRSSGTCERSSGEDLPLDLSQIRRNETENARRPDMKRILISEIGSAVIGLHHRLISENQHR